MIWLTWRQFRAQAVAVSVALVALVGILAGTGPRMAHDYSAGIAACTAQGDCTSFTRLFLRDHQTLYFGLVGVLLFLPAVIGLFLGGTAGLPGSRGRHPPAGVEPVRHPRPLAGRQARPDRPGRDGRRRPGRPRGELVVQPDRHGRARPVPTGPVQPSVDGAGQVVDALPASLATGACALRLRGREAPARGRAQAPPVPGTCFAAISQLGYRQQVTYQPASRFWAFQWYETAIFVGLALALAGFSFRWIRRLS
jgi:hypothetical protein